MDSLKDGIINKIVITDDDSKSFMVSSVDEVRKRICNAEKNAEYEEHESFWKEMGVN